MDKKNSINFDNKKILIFLVVGIIISGIVLRGLFLVADPPSDLTISGGLVGDAGQHAYGARNKILFGQWSFDDWKPHVNSPLINVPVNYPVYKFFGINFYSHKMIPLVFSSLALIGFVFLIYRYLGSFTCIISSIFISFSYPIIIYSKAANRYFPMIFFFLVAFYFFVEGASRKKSNFFVISGIFFVCSYFSQNHILYLISLFFVIGILWVLEKKIRFRHVALFFGTVFAGLATWYLFIFLPNREFFGFFVEHNKLVRRIRSPGQMLQNVMDNPFMFQVRNDPLLLIFASVAILFFIKLRLDKKNKMPVVVDACVAWLLIGTVFHSIWAYRPTRFHLILLFPAALLAGWILTLLKKNKPDMGFNLSGIFSLLFMHVFLIFIGILKYGRFFKSKLISNPLLWICFILFIAIFCLILFLKKRKIVFGFIIILILVSMGSNLKYFYVWAKNRKYKVVNTASVLREAIPVSNIAGNWASLLSTGTSHKTHLLSGEMGINWRKDFLKKNRIGYLLLTRGRFADELRGYRHFFKEEWSSSKRIALFKIYRSEVHLIELGHKTERENRIECETLRRSSGTVVFDPLASAKMSLKFENNRLKEPITLNLERPPLNNKTHILRIMGKGHVKGRVVVQQNGNTIKQGFIKFNSKDYQIREVLDVDLTDNFKIILKLSRSEKAFYLDCIEFFPY